MEKYITEVCKRILAGGVVKATKYVSPKQIVRASVTRYEKKLPAKGQNIEITLTIGKPNYIEREFIKDCQKSGEPFPVKNVITKSYNSPKPKKNLKAKK